MPGHGNSFVYIMTNQSTPGYVKVGFTERDPNARRKNLSSATGVIHEFELFKLYQFPENTGRIAEGIAHSALKKFHERKEFFKCAPTECERILDASFAHIPYAQYVDSSSGQLKSGIEIQDKIESAKNEISELSPRLKSLNETVLESERPFFRQAEAIKSNGLNAKLAFESKYQILHSYEYVFVGVQHFVAALILGALALFLSQEVDNSALVSLMFFAGAAGVIYYIPARSRKRIFGKTGFLKRMSEIDFETNALLSKNTEGMKQSTIAERNEIAELTSKIIVAQSTISQLDPKHLMLQKQRIRSTPGRSHSPNQKGRRKWRY